MTHISVDNLTIIGSDNGLSPGRRQAIIWTNAGILLIRTLGTNSSEILSEIRTFSFRKIHFKMSSAKWRPFCLGLNVLNMYQRHRVTYMSWFHTKFLLTFHTCSETTPNFCCVIWLSHYKAVLVGMYRHKTTQRCVIAPFVDPLKY